MAWDEATDGAAVFAAYLFEMMRPTNKSVGSWLRAANRMKLAAFNNTVTPDRAATLSLTAYGTGEWALAREVHSGAGSNWPAGGIRMDSIGGANSPAGSPGYPAMVLRAPQLVVAPVTIVGAVGDLLYDTGMDTANQGVAYHHWSGGPWDVTNGMLTVTWADGIVIGVSV